MLLMQAVETVGQAGKPKTITGFQTHKVRVPLVKSSNNRLWVMGMIYAVVCFVIDANTHMYIYIYSCWA